MSALPDALASVHWHRHATCMLVHCAVSGYYDWEHADKHPGVVITEADIKALRAKQLSNGEFHVRVEREAHVEPEHFHDTGIPELAICRHMVEQAKYAGNELGRADTVAHFFRQSSRHHIARRHIRRFEVHDSGPDVELMKAVLKEHEASDAMSADLLERYTEDVDLKASLSAQFAPRAKKGS